MGAFSFNHTKRGAVKKFPLFKRGGGRTQFYPVSLEGGGGVTTSFRPAIFPIL